MSTELTTADVKVGYSQPELDAALRETRVDAAAGQDTRRFGKSGRLVRSVDIRHFMNAVDAEGPEVATAAGAGYWADMDRRYPEITRRPVGPMTISLAARSETPGRPRNRLGRISFRKVYR